MYRHITAGNWFVVKMRYSKVRVDFTIYCLKLKRPIPQFGLWIVVRPDRNRKQFSSKYNTILHATYYNNGVLKLEGFWKDNNNTYIQAFFPKEYNYTSASIR
jgi:hypothetical protein